MSRIAFEAIDKSGGTVRGTLDAPDRAKALDQLIASGLTPFDIRHAHTSTSLRPGWRYIFGRRSFDYVGFLQEFAVLLKAGLPPERALTTLKALTLGANASPRIQQILEQVRGGEPVSQAFATSIPEAPSHIAGLLAAGEASGKLAEIASRVAEGLKKLKALKSRLISDLAYPCILVFSIAVVLWVMFHTVLPRLAPLFEQSAAAMPIATQVLLRLKSFFDFYGWWLFGMLIAAAIWMFRLLRTPRYRLTVDMRLLTSKWALGVPRAIEGALFCRNLQIILDGGLPLEKALGPVRDGIGNLWLKKEIAEVRTAVREGVRLSRALHSKAPSLPPVVAEFSAVGEETGRLADMMREAAELLEHHAQTRLNRLITLVSPLATLLMGGVVALLMAGIVGGILALNDVAR
ncbi:type II secretion system F family protein [Rhizomicrobium electricum]|uniref:type II secretion system F family protein n=1 Tax=Rhizomicrobium electricum TaxID=480070 RepID=UPI0014235D50|nr:general secretion pathway protein F [Rhizomicrobium electricum]